MQMSGFKESIVSVRVSLPPPNLWELLLVRNEGEDCGNALNL